jgi:hypothetical protein
MQEAKLQSVYDRIKWSKTELWNTTETWYGFGRAADQALETVECMRGRLKNSYTPSVKFTKILLFY